MLRVQALTAGYGVPVVQGVSIDVEPGRTTVLIGANGAGKTTTLKAIVGLISTMQGQIRVDDTVVRRVNPQAMLARGVALVPEGRGVLASLSVRENLLLGGYACRTRTMVHERLDRAMDLFPSLRRRSGTSAGLLSGGEQQMLAIARAMMSDPSYLLLDEPSLGLSPASVSVVQEELARLASEGLGILLVEQNAQLALGLADVGYVLDRGRITVHKPGDELRADTELHRAYLGMSSSDAISGISAAPEASC